MEQEFNTYDVKLTNGKYLSNIIVTDGYGACCSIKEILNNYYYKYEGIREDLLMSAWDEFDDQCENELATFYSADIEYIAPSYKNYN